MDNYGDNWNACLQFRNKQLTKQLKDFQKASAMTGLSSSLIVSVGQLLCLYQKPCYGIVGDEIEWHNLFTVIDLLYGGCLSEELAPYHLSAQELKLCYLVRTRLNNKTVAIIFNIAPKSVLKAKQRIKAKLSLGALDSFDKHIQQYTK